MAHLSPPDLRSSTRSVPPPPPPPPPPAATDSLQVPVGTVTRSRSAENLSKALTLNEEIATAAARRSGPSSPVTCPQWRPPDPILDSAESPSQPKPPPPDTKRETKLSKISGAFDSDCDKELEQMREAAPITISMPGPKCEEETERSSKHFLKFLKF